MGRGWPPKRVPSVGSIPTGGTSGPCCLSAFGLLRRCPRCRPGGRPPGAPRRGGPRSRGAVSPVLLGGASARGPRCGTCESAAYVGARTGDRHADDHALVALHGRTVVGPVRVLTGDGAVIAHEKLHGGWQRDHFGGPVHLNPVTEEAVAEHTQRCAVVASQVTSLDSRLAATDQRPAFRVNRGEHWRQL